MQKRLLNSQEAAEYLSISHAALRKMRCVGQSPEYIRFMGNIRYRIEDLDKWIDKQEVYTSTAEYLSRGRKP